MTHRILLGALLAGVLAWLPAVAQPSTPAGTWKTISDRTGKATSYVRIDEVDGRFDGTVVGLIDPPKPNPLCDLCSGTRKGRPVLGMTILRGVRAEGDGSWGGGDILDPQSGKTYRVRLTLRDGGQRLRVRGYIGIPLLGRTQTWIRVP